MFGLFLYVCYTFQPCQYEPQGWVYPDWQNCEADIRTQKLPRAYECLPVEAVLITKADDNEHVDE
ncbi:hypothetical protein [Brenneria uluponensis]|uniref:hypothetical protein n=1 Tax=Brenneria uluponensis TaxID=3057057 RepID=UPI0028EF9EC6|nr:hypothetical protein [Brenneria ulupoensis]